jgi:hypothetical protein
MVGFTHLKNLVAVIPAHAGIQFYKVCKLSPLVGCG